MPFDTAEKAERSGASPWLPAACPAPGPAWPSMPCEAGESGPVTWPAATSALGLGGDAPAAPLPSAAAAAPADGAGPAAAPHWGAEAVVGTELVLPAVVLAAGTELTGTVVVLAAATEPASAVVEGQRTAPRSAVSCTGHGRWQGWWSARPMVGKTAQVELCTTVCYEE